MRHEILFQKPIFHIGLNVTVRDGHRWMKVNIDDWLDIYPTGKSKIYLSGKVIAKALLPVRLIPEEFLQYEHDQSCHTKEGLLNELKRIYPNFSDQNIVTILFFYIYDLPNKI